MTRGFDSLNTDNNNYNLWRFLIEGALAKMSTSFLAEVIGIHPEDNSVDVLPLVQGVDAEGNELEQSPIYRIPYFSYRGGINEIKLTPTVGDYGICITSYRDISNIKKTGKRCKPATLRTFDPRDSLYLGCFLSKEQAKNYIEIKDAGVYIKTIGDLNINVDGDIEETSHENIVIRVEKDSKTSVISMSNDQINIETSGQSLTINESGTTIKTKQLSIDADTIKINSTKNISIKSDSSISVESSNYSNTAKETANFKTEEVNFHGFRELGHKFNIDGAATLTGNLFVKTINEKPPTIPGANDVATKGTLTTGSLYKYDEFISYLPEEGIRFKISIAESNLEIFIGMEDLSSINDYDGLANKINEQLNNLATLQKILDVIGNEQYQFITTGAGDVEGYISYMEDIKDNINATAGVLTTGDLGEWKNFKDSLTSQNLAFRITASNKTIIYQLLYSEIETKNNYEEFSEYLSSLNSNVIIETNSNKIIFKTLEKGSAKGRISYMKQTDTPSTPAVFLSGDLPTYGDFINSMDSQNFAVKNNVNGEELLYYIGYKDLSKFNNYSDFLKSAFSKISINANYTSNNVINITTKLAGNGATITFFEPVEKIDAKVSRLETGYLPDFAEIKKNFKEVTSNFTGYINADGKEINFVITADEFLACDTWNDLAKELDESSENSKLNISFSGKANKIIFAMKNTGVKSLSYMMYKEPGEEEEPTINLTNIILSNESTASLLEIGAEAIKDINPNSNSILKLIEAAGAKITNGKEVEFAPNSIALMKGTQDTGADLVQGRDGVIVMKNNSATLLKGTLEEGAIRIPGSDSGIPDVYDGIAKINGKLLVTKEVETDSVVTNLNTNMTGAIVLNPYDIDESGEVYEKSDVIVNGGIIAENLVVSETATINNLIVNDGVEINGDIKLNNSKITGNGNTMSFDSNGIRNNKMFIGSDFMAD